ncbi:MAG: 2-alkenal reductase, partial [Desulfobulbales bacterium]
MAEYRYPQRRFPSWFILILVLFGLWWLTDRGERPKYDKTAEPRVVEARGSLAEDEKNTIDVFQEVAPSVVYITSIEVRRSLFSLNVYEIP